MKKIILIGRSECGKTTLTQAMRCEKILYHKTQYVNRYDVIIDTPGEYIQQRTLGGALAVYSFEAQVIGLLLSATEPFSLYSPCITGMATREVIGIITKVDHKNARVDLAEHWLRLAGCRTIFQVNSRTGEGVGELIDHLREPGDVLPWDLAHPKPENNNKTDDQTAENLKTNKNNSKNAEKQAKNNKNTSKNVDMAKSL